MRNFLRPLLLVALSAAPATAQALRGQDFATPPAWTLTGTGSNANNFGYRTSAFAGGGSGEAGGTFTRSNFDRIYADTNLGGTLDLSTPMTAAGRLEIRNASSADLGPGLVVGHFNSATQASMGLIINQDLTTTDGVYIALLMRFSATDVQQVRMDTGPTTGVARTWSYAWDPNGGHQGGGLLTGSVGGSNGGSASIDLTPAERALLPAFDAFGLYGARTSPLSGNPNQPTWFVQAYIDDVTYTVVPEFPFAGWALLLAGVLGWSPTCRRREPTGRLLQRQR